MQSQSNLFRGIYQFEDPSGALIAARVPAGGATDLYEGTKIFVRPNQVAFLVFNGQIADFFGAGMHELKIGNIPIITRLLNWKFGFQSTLQAEIWFFSGQNFMARKWGTSQPVLATFGNTNIPLRAFGSYNIRLKDPKSLYLNLIGSRSSYDIAELQDFMQAQISECLPESLTQINDIRNLNTQQAHVARHLEATVGDAIKKYGFVLEALKVASITPPQEVLKAMDEKLAMEIIGDPKAYMIYKAANRFDSQTQGHGAVEAMMAMMLSRDLMNSPTTSSSSALLPNAKQCSKCHGRIGAEAKFCAHCGFKLEPV